MDLIEPEVHEVLDRLSFGERLLARLISVYCLILYPDSTTPVPVRRPAPDSRQEHDYNALRHVLWLGLLTLGLNEDLARMLADNHEFENKTDEWADDMAVDLANNEIGIAIAKDVNTTFLTGILEVHRHVFDAFRNGRFYGCGEGHHRDVAAAEKKRLFNRWKERTGEACLPWESDEHM